MNLYDIQNQSSDDQLAEALNNSAVAIQNAADILKNLKAERATELKRIVEDRGEFTIGTTKVYMGVKKSSKQATADKIISEIALHAEDVFGAITSCLSTSAFKKSSTQKIIGKNETLFWDVVDEKVIEKVVKEVDTTYIK